MSKYQEFAVKEKISYSLNIGICTPVLLLRRTKESQSKNQEPQTIQK